MRCCAVSRWAAAALGFLGAGPRRWHSARGSGDQQHLRHLHVADPDDGARLQRIGQLRGELMLALREPDGTS